MKTFLQQKSYETEYIQRDRKARIVAVVNVIVRDNRVIENVK